MYSTNVQCRTVRGVYSIQAFPTIVWSYSLFEEGQLHAWIFMLFRHLLYIFKSHHCQIFFFALYNFTATVELHVISIRIEKGL